MRYSQIIGECYHKISLPKRQRDRLDLFFTGAAHHFYRFKESRRDSPEEGFHDLLFRAHMRELMRVIYEHGDFALAIDPSGLGLHIRARWKPDNLERLGLPDREMFGEMYPDPRCGINECHPNDRELPLCAIRRSAA
jgi:hypothetical protein